VEQGTIEHVPSTQDLLVAQGISTGRLRTTASRIAASCSQAPPAPLFAEAKLSRNSPDIHTRGLLPYFAAIVPRCCVVEKAVGAPPLCG